MSTFSIYTHPNEVTRGSRFTKKADSTVLFGALVQKGTDAGDVKESDAADNDIYGISVPNEVQSAENDAEEYDDGDTIVVEGLISGKLYNLLNGGTAAVSEGAEVEASANGTVVAGTTDPVGIAVDGIAGSARGPVMWRPVRNDA